MTEQQATATAQIFDAPGSPMRQEAVALPSRLEEGEVLVAISLATICGSDLHTISGHRKERTPCILGHEAVGTVVGTGTGRGDLKAGDRVTWTIADSCGGCAYCTEYEMPEKCASVFKYGHASVDDGSGLNGCYASHILLRRGTHVVRIPDSLEDAVVAPANCALSTMVNAISHVPSRSRSVVLQGAGMLGLYGCALLRERGVEHVFCVEVDERRLAQIERFGGKAIDGRTGAHEAGRSEVLDACPNGVDAVIEAAGVSALVSAGFDLMRIGGTYVFVGMVHPDSQLDVTGEQIIRKCATIRGVHNYGPRHLDGAIAFLARTGDEYPYAEMVSAPFALEDLGDAVRVAGERKYGRVAVKP